MAVARGRSWMGLALLLVLTVASAVWSASTTHPAARGDALKSRSANDAPLAPSPRTPISPATVTTEKVSVNPPTTIIKYPNPYHPNYATIASLADDSTFIVIATIGPEETDGYPLDVQQVIGTNPVKTSIGITTTEFESAHLAVGGTYIFFWGADPVENAVCIVGGVRGVFVYDTATQIVTRLAQDTASHIPNTQTLTQLENAIHAAERIVAGQPDANTPPLCNSSATGLP